VRKVHNITTLASTLTTSRLGNAAKILASYYHSRMIGRPVLRGMPISIGIEPTTSCNLRCPECPSGLRSFTRPTGMLSETLFARVIDELKDNLTYLTFYFQGEPFLHPTFLSLVSQAASRKIFTSTSTNAHYFTDANARATVESGLNRLIISIDGTTQEVYEAYRVGGSLEKVVEGTKRILHWRNEMNSSMQVVFQFLVVKPNQHQIADVRRLANDLGVDDVLYKTAQIYDYQRGSDLIPTDDKYSRYNKKTDGTYRIKNPFENHCWKMWQSCVITWDGKVVPCCFDKDAHHVMGDLNQSTFQEIWTGEKYHQFRSTLLRSRSEVEMCRNCTEGTQVWA
jgi:radical SAM protein with 4Fe4S-binding SPASM domain